MWVASRACPRVCSVGQLAVEPVLCSVAVSASSICDMSHAGEPLLHPCLGCHVCAPVQAWTWAGPGSPSASRSGRRAGQRGSPVDLLHFAAPWRLDVEQPSMKRSLSASAAPPTSPEASPPSGTCTPASCCTSRCVRSGRGAGVGIVVVGVRPCAGPHAFTIACICSSRFVV